MADQTVLIKPAELQSRLADPGIAVLDCRFDLLQPQAGAQAYLEGHIPGAVYANLDTDLAGPVRPGSGRHPLPAMADFAHFAGTAGIDSSTMVVVYDAASGAIAARAWWLLRWLGHDRVAILEGGLAAWRDAGGAMLAGTSRATARLFEAQPRPERIIDTAELAASPDIAGLQLLDAREPGRFRGEHEPIDSRAGHIPGARNLPFSRTQGPDHRWLDRQALRRLWAELPGFRPDRPWIAMCGSGVTACQLVAAGLRAGLAEPRLYVGSWSEWIRDPDRPVATAAD